MKSSSKKYDEPPSEDAEPAKPKVVHKVLIVDSHMANEYEKTALEVTLAAVDEHKQLKDIAWAIKTNIDKKYPGSGKATEGVFHAIVGTNFASTVSHETRMYIHLQVDKLHVIIWKSKDSPFQTQEA